MNILRFLYSNLCLPVSNQRCSWFLTHSGARLRSAMIVTATLAAICMAGAAFYVRFVIALCKECRQDRICPPVLLTSHKCDFTVVSLRKFASPGCARLAGRHCTRWRPRHGQGSFVASLRNLYGLFRTNLRTEISNECGSRSSQLCDQEIQDAGSGLRVHNCCVLCGLHCLRSFL
jgi:hypothetical protein